MRWQYLGNFDPENSTENHVALALRRTGHEVVQRQENDLGAWRAAAEEMADFDVTLWTRTGWEPQLPRNLQRLVLQAGRERGVPVVGFHLDRWWGLQREPQVARELFFRADLVVTADGGHDDRWAEAGVNHLWLPPGVSGAQAEELGTYREEYDVPLGFVGSWQGYHDEWAYRGRLVRWLMEHYGDRFQAWEGGVRGRDLADLYTTVDVLVGDSCLAGGATHYWSDRIPETLGRGGLLVHPMVEGLAEHFTPGEHLLTYELGDFDGLRAVVDEALADGALRARVRLAGRAHVLAHHTYERRVAQLVEALEARGMLPTGEEDRAPGERPLRVSMDLVPVAEEACVVDVLWLHGHGWWDQGLLTRLLDGEEWTPPGGYRFRQYVADDHPTGPGLVLVVPGRFVDVAQVQRILDEREWAVVVVTSDEESLFSWWELRHPAMRLWVQTADRDGDFQPLGEGFAADFPELLAAKVPDRVLDWTFAGQLTHERRQEAVAAMRTLSTPGGGALTVTDRFLSDEGLTREQYAGLLQTAKVVPCPSGPETPDTFRGWEALEAGALPILDNRTPRDDRPGYWQRLIGDAPIPRISDWSTLPALMEALVADWPRNANRAQAWWLQWKRALAWRMQDDLAELAGRPRPSDLRQLVTVIVPTSPIPSHPELDVLTETLASVRHHLPESEVIIAADGVRPEQAHMAPAYEEYLRRLLWASARDWLNVLPVLLDAHGHQANSTRRALEFVRTPLVLYVEHDTPLTTHEPLPWDGLCRAVLTGAANSVRFHHEAQVLEPHEYLMLDRQPVEVEGVPMLRTIQWSQRPHLASTEFYRSLLARHFPPSSRTMIEDRMHSVAQQQPWEATRLWLYAPDGDMKRSLHLDGRQGEPKFDMVYR